MASYFTIFDNETQYDEYCTSEEFVAPNVSYVADTEIVRFKKKKEPVPPTPPTVEFLTCTYNVVEAPAYFSLYNKLIPSGGSGSGSGNGDNSGNDTVDVFMRIDGGEWMTPESAYTFDTTGEHTVEFSGITGELPGESFSYIDTLINVEIPDSVTNIADAAFYECVMLTGITIPDSVTSIGYSAFYDCHSLTNIEIPSGVTYIDSSAFIECSSLTNIEIPNGVTYIGSSAFAYCHSLTNIEIPSGVTSIGSSAFNGCSGLTNITVNAITPPTIGGPAVFHDTNDCPIYVPANSVNAYKTAQYWSNYASRIQAIP